MGVERRNAPNPTGSEVRWSYGVLNGGAELMHQSWGNLHHRFSVASRNSPGATNPGLSSDPLPLNLKGLSHSTLGKQPVDILVVEQGHLICPPSKFRRYEWEDTVKHTRPSDRPQVIIESWASNAQLWCRGPVSKGHVTSWTKLG